MSRIYIGKEGSNNYSGRVVERERCKRAKWAIKGDVAIIIDVERVFYRTKIVDGKTERNQTSRTVIITCENIAVESFSDSEIGQRKSSGTDCSGDENVAVAAVYCKGLNSVIQNNIALKGDVTIIRRNIGAVQPNLTRSCQNDLTTSSSNITNSNVPYQRTRGRSKVRSSCRLSGRNIGRICQRCHSCS